MVLIARTGQPRWLAIHVTLGPLSFVPCGMPSPRWGILLVVGWLGGLLTAAMASLLTHKSKSDYPSAKENELYFFCGVRMNYT